MFRGLSIPVVIAAWRAIGLGGAITRRRSITLGRTVTWSIALRWAISISRRWAIGRPRIDCCTHNGKRQSGKSGSAHYDSSNQARTAMKPTAMEPARLGPRHRCRQHQAGQTGRNQGSIHPHVGRSNTVTHNRSPSPEPGMNGLPLIARFYPCPIAT